MNLEKQVVSLELAKRLKELGVKQESLFYYQKQPYHDNEPDMVIKITEGGGTNMMNINEININPLYSAFTVAELGQIIPDNFASFKNKGMYAMAWNEDEFSLYGKYISISFNEADERAKMLIYLIENGLM